VHALVPLAFKEAQEFLADFRAGRHRFYSKRTFRKPLKHRGKEEAEESLSIARIANSAEIAEIENQNLEHRGKEEAEE
jgi:hypothetical protein